MQQQKNRTKQQQQQKLCYTKFPQKYRTKIAKISNSFHELGEFRAEKKIIPAFRA